MKKMMFRQAGLCILMALALAISANSGIPVLEEGAAAVMQHISVNNTVEDLEEAADKGRSIAASATGMVGEAVSIIAGKPVYGKPIDDEITGGEAPVYAVAGGQVTAVGENEEIGKYVRLIHGNQAESLYGNLQTVNVSVPSNVKKGQIIGIYEKNEEKDFFFSLKEKE